MAASTASFPEGGEMPLSSLRTLSVGRGREAACGSSQTQLRRLARRASARLQPSDPFSLDGASSSSPCSTAARGDIVGAFAAHS